MGPAQILLIVYAAIGCLYWTWLAVGLWRVARGVPELDDDGLPEPPRWPRLSVLVPACNEAETIEPAMAALLAQDYPDLEIVLIDDRSTDATGEIVDRLAQRDPRVRPVHVTELPDGWLGKVHALDQGVRQASGEFLLMMDADVHLRPGMLRRAVAWCEDRQVDHLAAVPHLVAGTFLLRLAIAMFLRTFSVTMRLWAVSNPRSSAYIGVGAFNLVRRNAFDRTKGFAWLRLEVADDVGLGLMMKQSGARSEVVVAHRQAEVCWYPSLGDMARGVEKGFASVAHCSLLRLAAVCVVSAVLELAPLVAISAWGMPIVQAMGLAMVLLAVACAAILYVWVKEPLWTTLLYPLAVPLNIALLIRCGWLGWRRGGIMWRGTLYPNHLLRDNLRVKFP